MSSRAVTSASPVRMTFRRRSTVNNFVSYRRPLRMAQLLRDHPDEVGLVTTVSGMLTKQACRPLGGASPARMAGAI